MADDGRDAASSLQIQHRPEHAKRAGDDHRVSSLDEVPRAEQRAQYDNADGGSAEMALESPQQERPLQLLPHAPREDGDDAEQRRVEPSAGGQLLERVRG